jgi:hypothetical protein
MLSQNDALELVHDRLYPLYRAQRTELDIVDSWYRWDHEKPTLPKRASEEHKWLAELARTPWLNIVVTTVAQALYCNGYKSAIDTSPYKTWQANDFDHRQTAIHRAALAYGMAFVTVMPGEDANGARSVMRGVSPRKMVAVYADAAEDDWPMFAARFDKADQNNYMVRLIDEEAVYYVSLDASGDNPQFIEPRVHDAGVCPVVRYTNMLDLDGRADGEVAPLIPLAKRIDKTDYDRLLAQHFNSWKVRVISGIDATQGPGAPREGEDPALAAERALTRLQQNDIITLKDPSSRATTLDETSLEGFIKAKGSDIDSLAAIAQVPVTALNGGVSNISADALVELRAGLNQKSKERQKSFGKSHVQALRLAAHLEGNAAAATDYDAKMDWEDTQVRPWSQTVDALGKAAQMLGVPPQELWEELPWLDQNDLEDMRRSAAQAAAQEARARLANAANQARQDPAVANLVNRANNG